MFRSLRRLFFVLCLLALQGRAAGTDWWEQLAVRTVDGAEVTPAGRWIVVVFLSPECPVANAEIPVLNALSAEFAPRGFSFVGAYADPGLTLPDLRRHAADYHLGYPAADDRGQRLARAAGATYTPEVCVFSRAGVLLYRGRIDDRVEDFGAARPQATHEDLRDVLTALAAGQPGPFANRPGFGCSIPGRVRP
jgi:thiol-disulfide isomerase/thioredoxin